MSPARRRFAWFLLFLSPALFGVNMLAARYVTFVPPNALALGRWLLFCLILLPIVWRELHAKRDAIGREWLDLLLLGALGMWVCGAFVYIGGRTTEALNIGLIYAASPIVVLIFGRERLTPGRLVGIILCLLGVVAVFAKGQLGNLLGVRLASGDLWIAAASAAWAVYSLLLKQRPSAFDPLARLCLIASGGVLILVPFTIGEALLFGGPDLGDSRVWIAWLIVATVPGLGAYAAYSFCVAELGPSSTSVSMYLGPPYVGLMAWAALGEAPHWYHLLGIALVLPGLFLVARPVPKPAPKRT